MANNHRFYVMTTIITEIPVSEELLFVFNLKDTSTDNLW